MVNNTYSAIHIEPLHATMTTLWPSFVHTVGLDVETDNA